MKLIDGGNLTLNHSGDRYVDEPAQFFLSANLSFCSHTN